MTAPEPLVQAAAADPNGTDGVVPLATIQAATVGPLYHHSPYAGIVDGTEPVLWVEGVDEHATAVALRTLTTVPDHYASTGAQFVTHAPLSAFAFARDAGALEQSNRAAALRELEPYTLELRDDGEPDVIDGRVRHWAVGWLDVIDVRPWVRTVDDRAWVVTDAWREAVALLDAYRDDPILDPDDYYEREHDELVAAILAETGEDDPSDPFAAAILEDAYASGQVSDAEDLHYYYRDGGLEQAITLTYATLAEPLVAAVRAWDRLRRVGDGQLTIDGGIVRVPERPDPDALRALTVDALPGPVGRIVEHGETHAAVLEALDTLEAATALQ